MANAIKIINAALDEQENEIVLRGRIDPGSFSEIQVAPYQREILPIGKISSLMKAFKEKLGSIPDIDLGMRGEKYTQRDDALYLQDPTFVIDGLQRLTAAKKLKLASFDAWLGCTVHFNSTEESERQRFRVLNADRTKLNSNILIRNLKDGNECISMLYRLCDDRSFALAGKVAWSQNQQRQHIISANTLLNVVGMLHSHIGPGRHRAWYDLAPHVNNTMQKIGRNIFRGNIVTFFDTIDQCWGVRNIAFAGGAVHMRNTFLFALADLFSRHGTFWRDNRLFVESSLIHKIKIFPISDPSVVTLASAGGKGKDVLYNLFVDHINSGKRTRRIKPR